ncbi:MAG: phosphoglycerate kinase [Phenylobacterium sp. RIFCSPHIGHO2_01_FULL_69_31]|uniref:phosphoglycerate kinase n=1 Tax=Phenylobacterium sp. RIFCSPHIGHO2_01_FULL_69_31 TaxID=1801944 RepID=UPI0008D87204|nr:phosphoglycerate kinase [Phenylobacterium sp. RIFCSPHIGHO2_01_FULL_69_31]OHB27515.1 MAG: phosphoglycerate kinase [Phenylobacterium sp. RIFCSPHIGHO2_01_FULL_69_31]
MTFKTLDDADLSGKRALVRVDFNVPMADGEVSDDTRLRAALPTIEKLRQGGAKTILLAHFDRPKGKRVPEMSLKPVVGPLSKLLGAPVAFADDCVGDEAAKAVAAMKDGDVLLLENVRYHAGEEKNEPDFAKALAANGDLYVNDAFSAAHRAHASTEGLARRLPAYAGEQMRKELEALDAALGKPQRPVMGIVGGAKVSTKLDLLNNLVGKLDYLAIGGGMANTFCFAKGAEIGGSLCEKEMADTAREILQKAEAAGCKVILPVDVVVAKDLAPNAPNRTIDLADGVPADEKIFDIGPKALEQVLAAMSEAKTLIWNGPFGVFEVEPFDKATVDAAKHAAQLAKTGRLVAVAGGGDTVAALNAAGVSHDFTFVSTAGGAFLEWMEGKELPGVAALSQ